MRLIGLRMFSRGGSVGSGALVTLMGHLRAHRRLRAVVIEFKSYAELQGAVQPLSSDNALPWQINGWPCTLVCGGSGHCIDISPITLTSTGTSGLANPLSIHFGLTTNVQI